MFIVTTRPDVACDIFARQKRVIIFTLNTVLIGYMRQRTTKKRVLLIPTPQIPHIVVTRIEMQTLTAWHKVDPCEPIRLQNK